MTAAAAGPVEPAGTTPGEAERGRAGTPQWKLTALGVLLDRAGVAWRSVRAAGGEGEIAVVDAPRTEMPALTGLAPEVRRLGFRFVALDLAAGTGNRVDGHQPSVRSAPTLTDEGR